MIEINEKYFIEADNYNIILRERYFVKDKKSKNFGVPLERDIGYYGTVPDALCALFERKCKELIQEKEFANYKDIIKDMRSIKQELENNLQENNEVLEKLAKQKRSK